MNDESKTAISEQQTAESALTDRRDFVRKAGKAAIAVPAVALLLSMQARSAHAVPTSGGLNRLP